MAAVPEARPRARPGAERGSCHHSRMVRALVVARWYASHDMPARSPFVLDQVRMLGAMGAEIIVAAADYLPTPGITAQGLARAEAAWAPSLSEPRSLSRPTSWGVPGMPVARIPVVVPKPWSRVVAADNEATALRAFGTALHRRSPIDFIHAHTGVPDGIAAGPLADLLGVPLIVTEHESTVTRWLADPIIRERYRLMFERHRLVVVSSSHARRIAAAIGVEPGAVAVLPNPVDVVAFRADPLGLRDRRQLLFVGNRKASKGIERLLRAFAQVREAGHDVCLRVIGAEGSPDEESAWASLTGLLGIADVVSFEPQASRAAVADAMARAWAFVHPSAMETFGVVAAEAIASGLPVAATPSGGVNELLGADGSLGEVAADPTPEGLSAAVIRLLARRPALDPAELRSHAVQTWSSEAISRRMSEILATVGVRLPSAETPASAATPPRTQLPIVVGMRRGAADHGLAALQPALASELTVITRTAGHRRSGTRLVAPCRWREVDAERDYHAAAAAIGGPGPRRNTVTWWLAAAGSPRAIARRLMLRRKRAAYRRRAERAFILRVWQEAAAQTGPPPALLPLDAADVLLVEPLLAHGARLAPGTLRWLADAYDEAHAAEPGQAPDVR